MQSKSALYRKKQQSKVAVGGFLRLVKREAGGRGLLYRVCGQTEAFEVA